MHGCEAVALPYLSSSAGGGAGYPQWLSELAGSGALCDLDVAPGSRSRLNNSPQPARLGRRRTHRLHHAHSGAGLSLAQDRRAAVRPRYDFVDACRVTDVTQLSYHCWRQHYGGMPAEEPRRLTRLGKENAWLKKLLAEAELEKGEALAAGFYEAVGPCRRKFLSPVHRCDERYTSRCDEPSRFSRSVT